MFLKRIELNTSLCTDVPLDFDFFYKLYILLIVIVTHKILFVNQTFQIYQSDFEINNKAYGYFTAEIF